MKRFASKPNTVIPSTPAIEVDNTPASDISIIRLIDDGLVALNREIKNILILSVKGKLDAPTARDLRDHLKLLFELKDRENESLRSISDEELKEKAQAALNEDS